MTPVARCVAAAMLLGSGACDGVRALPELGTVTARFEHVHAADVTVRATLDDAAVAALPPEHTGDALEITLPAIASGDYALVIEVAYPSGCQLKLAEQISVAAGEPATVTHDGLERCDSLDNDCDGATDESNEAGRDGLGERCAGLGFCGDGVGVCDGESVVCNHQPELRDARRPGPGDVLLTELLADPSAGDANGDGETNAGDRFIELVNVSEAPLDLSCGRLYVAGAAASFHVFPPGLRLEALEHYVLFAADAASEWALEGPSFELRHEGADSSLIFAVEGGSEGERCLDSSLRGQSITRDFDEDAACPWLGHRSLDGGQRPYSPGAPWWGQQAACDDAPDGRRCDDGRYCTVGDHCEAGRCVSGAERSCHGLCEGSLCDDDSYSCTPVEVPDDTPCDDGLACTLDTVCRSGVCEAGRPVDCSAQDGLCLVGECVEPTGECTAALAAEGSLCEDELTCTGETRCNSRGECEAVAPVCEDFFDNCCGEARCVDDERACACFVATTAGESSVEVALGDACGEGACAGVYECGGGLRCSTEVGGSEAPADPFEWCDGLDNDCDGDIDEDYLILGDACDVDWDDDDTPFGRQRCLADGSGTRCDGDAPGLELCNGLDDDGDGRIDEGEGDDARPSAATLELTEVHHAAQSEESFIELLNPGDSAADLSCLRVEVDGVARYQFPPDVRLVAGESFLLFGGGAPARGAFQTSWVDAGAGDLGLSPAGGVLRFLESAAPVLTLPYGPRDPQAPAATPGRDDAGEWLGCFPDNCPGAPRRTVLPNLVAPVLVTEDPAEPFTAFDLSGRAGGFALVTWQARTTPVNRAKLHLVDVQGELISSELLRGVTGDAEALAIAPGETHLGLAWRSPRIHSQSPVLQVTAVTFDRPLAPFSWRAGHTPVAKPHDMAYGAGRFGVVYVADGSNGDVVVGTVPDLDTFGGMLEESIVATSDDIDPRPRMVGRHGGFAVTWQDSSAGSREIRWARLDGTGARVGPVMSLPGSSAGERPDLVWSGDGYYFSFLRRESATGYALVVVAVDEAGRLRRGPVTLDRFNVEVGTEPVTRLIHDGAELYLLWERPLQQALANMQRYRVILTPDLRPIGMGFDLHPAGDGASVPAIARGGVGLFGQALIDPGVGLRFQHRGRVSNFRLGEAPPGWVCLDPGTMTLGLERRAAPGADSALAHSEVEFTRALQVRATEVTRAEVFAWLGASDPDTGCLLPSCPATFAHWSAGLRVANALSERDGLPPCYPSIQCDTEADSEYPSRCHSYESDEANLASCEGYRLLDDVEWERAARAGVPSGPFQSGVGVVNDACLPVPRLDALAWNCHNGGGAGMRPVALRVPGPTGIFDLHGNAPEWVYGAVHPGSASLPQTVDPIGFSSDGDFAQRGGSISDPVYALRIEGRQLIAPDTATPRRAAIRLGRHGCAGP